MPFPVFAGLIATVLLFAAATVAVAPMWASGPGLAEPAVGLAVLACALLVRLRGRRGE